MERPGVNSGNSFEMFQQQLQEELEQARRTLKEVSLMIQQSQAEMTKLNQRNTAVNGQLQQVLGQFETLPRGDIKNAYNAVLDAQQRVLVMRGQLEKLQTDQANLQRTIELLERMVAFIGEGGGKTKTAGRTMAGGAAALEMVVNAQESVRQRLSQQMHDGPAQALSNFILQTDIASRLFDIDPERAKEELSNLRGAAMTSFQKVRGFITELRPMMLDDLGLFPTLKRYVDVLKEQSGQDITLTIKGQERRLESYLEVMIFRAVQELIGNALRHNQDPSNRLSINGMVTIDDANIRVTVSDNGKGFDEEILSETTGLGLKLIRERVELLGGYLDLETAPGKGVKITFQVPCLEAKTE